MKTTLKVFFYLCILFALPNLLSAQTITINSVSGTNFCVGDSISITFTVTGNWGHKNAFTLQLSDVNGSFATFANLGSIGDTVPGIFTAISVIPTSLTPSSFYRIRIIGAYPYTKSADNGSNIAIHRKPVINSVSFSSSGTPVVGTPIDFTITSDDFADTSQDIKTVTWDFGADATPVTAIDSITQRDSNGTMVASNKLTHLGVMYSTTGTKTITATITNGCSVTFTTSIVIYGCSVPSISHRTIVIDHDTSIFDPLHVNLAYWINPGITVSYNAAQMDTFYLEPGASLTLTSGFNRWIYMKSGSSLNGGNQDWVTYDSGASITNANSNSILCAGLTFDYTNAPPNKAFQPIGCSPAIPSTAVVVDSSNQILKYSNKGKSVSFWVNPGVNIQFWGIGEPQDTIYIEPGASVESFDHKNIYYVKPGGALNVTSDALFDTVFYSAESSIINSGHVVLIHCVDLSFDYTNAPPNKAFAKGVKEDAALAEITLSPNPATESIAVNNIPPSVTVMSLFDILGKSVMQIAPTHSSNMVLDLRTLEAGTYYLRFVSQSGVVTKKIVKN